MCGLATPDSSGPFALTDGPWFLSTLAESRENTAPCPILSEGRMSHRPQGTRHPLSVTELVNQAPFLQRKSSFLCSF